MEYRKLGKSDLKVSRIGLGGMQFGSTGIGIHDKKKMKKIINHALDNGVNFIDTAEIYGRGISESVIGETIKERGDRDNLVIATKVYPMHLNYDEVIKAAEWSLKRLQTEVIDLYQVHHPNCYVPISETMKAMDKLLKDGKVRYIGVSNFQACLTEEAITYLKGGEVIANQLEYNILMRGIEQSILPHLRERSIVTIAYSPLSGGLLTGKYDETFEFPKEDRRSQWALLANKQNRLEMKPLLEIMKDIAKKHNGTIPQVAINWLLKYDDVFPIVGAKSIEQIETNIGAAKWKMSEEEWDKVTGASDKIKLDLFLEFGYS